MLKRVKNGQFNAEAYFLGRFDVCPSNAYLLIGHANALSKIVGSPTLDKGKRLMVREVDGVPHAAIRCSNRFRKHLLSFTDIVACYKALSQYLSDVDVREYFYEIWLGFKNQGAKKQRSNKMARLQVSGNMDLGYISHLTGGMSKRESALNYGRI